MIQIPLSDISEEFHRAHTALLKKLGGTDLLIRQSEYLRMDYFTILSQEWNKHYNITPLPENRWEFLEFKNEPQYTMFLVRWS